MQAFRDLPIRTKIVLAIVGTSSVTVLIVTIVTLVSLWVGSRNNALEDTTALTRTFGLNTVAALTFDDRDSASETLGALKLKEEIMAGCLYDVDGGVFAAFTRTQAVGCPDSAPAEGSILGSDTLTVTEPITLDGEQIGSLFINRNLDSIWAAMRVFATLSALMIAACTLLAFLMAAIIQNVLARPILELLSTANQVSSDRDYSLRAEKSADDEVGDLIDGFNEMLAQVEKRDRELGQARSALESRIEETNKANSELEDALKQLQETQQQLVNTEKMASLGGLVAGIAHEINTPVGVGVTAASTLKSTSDQVLEMYNEKQLTGSGLKKYISNAQQSADIILSNLNRAAELIHSFKQVAVDQSSSELRRFALGEYIHEILLSLRPQLKKTNLEVVVDCDASIAMNSYAGALSQVLTNLTMNSILHAYAEGEEGVIKFEARSDGNTLHLSYSDDGKGIPPDHQAKVFDPFFTTRRGQGGSGLGMHILFNLVTQQLQGTVKLWSELGKGARFDLVIPLDITQEKTAANA